MAYRISFKKDLDREWKRVAREQIERAIDDLSRSDENLDRSVHQARKRIKKLRALLRLFRAEIGSTRKRENDALRDIAGRLAPLRSAAALDQALKNVLDASREDEAVLRRAVQAHDDTLASERQPSDAAESVREAREQLEAVRGRLDDWPHVDDSFSVIKPGLKRIYRQGAERLAAAQSHPSAENTHEWRKPVKNLWYSVRLLQSAQPRKLRRLRRQLRDLSELLGDHHDLCLLAKALDEHPAAKQHCEARDRVIERCRCRADKLQEEAFELGKQVYRLKPRRFVRMLRKGVEERYGAALQL